MSEVYVTTHNNWDPNLTLPLPVIPFNGESLFVDPIWGIKIESVFADGVLIQAGEYDVFLDDINQSKLKVGPFPFIYTIRLCSFYVATQFTDDNYSLESYAIDRSVEHIKIIYRLRVAPNNLGPPLTLDSYLV